MFNVGIKKFLFFTIYLEISIKILHTTSDHETVYDGNSKSLLKLTLLFNAHTAWNIAAIFQKSFMKGLEYVWNISLKCFRNINMSVQESYINIIRNIAAMIFKMLLKDFKKYGSNFSWNIYVQFVARTYKYF